MATFNITIKTRYTEGSKTINATSLTVAKAQATAAFNALSSSRGRIVIANESGAKLSHKLIENSRGKWKDVTSGELVEKEYTVAFTIEKTGEQCAETVKAENLQSAKREASCLRDNACGAWGNDSSIFDKDGVKLAELKYVFGPGFRFVDCEPQEAPAQEVAPQLPQEIAQWAAKHGKMCRCVIADPVQEAAPQGFSSRCITVTAPAAPAKQEAPKKSFVINFTQSNQWLSGSVTIEETDLDQAMMAAELLQINNGWCEVMDICDTDSRQLAVRREFSDGYQWAGCNDLQLLSQADYRSLAMRNLWKERAERAADEELARVIAGDKKAADQARKEAEEAASMSRSESKGSKLQKFDVTFFAGDDSGFARTTIEAKDRNAIKIAARKIFAMFYPASNLIIVRDHETGRKLSRMHIAGGARTMWFDYDAPKPESEEERQARRGSFSIESIAALGGLGIAIKREGVATYEWIELSKGRANLFKCKESGADRISVSYGKEPTKCDVMISEKAAAAVRGDLDNPLFVVVASSRSGDGVVITKEEAQIIGCGFIEIGCCY